MKEFGVALLRGLVTAAVIAAGVYGGFKLTDYMESRKAGN